MADIRIGGLHAYRPLRERVPTRDAHGARLTDFMLLFPGLRDRPRLVLHEIVARIQAVLAQFHEVVFVDLNLPLNLLWISARPRPGIVLAIATAVRHCVPGALLIGHQPPR